MEVIMRKFLFLAITCVFGLMLVACEGATTQAPTTTAAPTTAAPTTAAPTTAAPTTAAPTTAAPTTAVPTTEVPTTDAPTTVEAPELAVVYSGTHTAQSMSGEVVYLYYMSFVDGNYEFYSSYEMGGETYDFAEVGTYTLVDLVLTITPLEGTAQAGTLNNDGSIEVPVKPSDMGARAARSLVPVDELPLGTLYEGTHTVTAMSGTIVYHYQIAFIDGAYEFYSTYEMGEELYDYSETGTYVVEGNVLTMTPSVGEAADGLIHVDGSLQAPIKASDMGSRALRELTPIADLTLQAEYEGTHTATSMAGEVVYTYTMSFADGNYSFVSDFVMDETPYQYTETGIYTVEGNVLTLDPSDSDAVTGVIHVDGDIDAPIKGSSMATRALHVMTPVVEDVV
jgi:hypothetical protein